MSTIDNRVSIEGLDNDVSGEGSFGKNGTLKIIGNRNRVRIGNKTNLNQLRLEITGDDCEFSIGSGCKLRGFIQIKHCGSRIVIGDKTTATGVNMIALEGKSILIGQDCMFSFNIEVRTSDAHAVLDLETRKRINLAADVVLGDHIWVGARTAIAKGASIADDVIVGQGSLVNKRFSQSHCVIAGTPAEVKRTGVTWDRDLATGLTNVDNPFP